MSIGNGKSFSADLPKLVSKHKSLDVECEAEGKGCNVCGEQPNLTERKVQITEGIVQNRTEHPRSSPDFV
jgi:hypothetical protein